MAKERMEGEDNVSVKTEPEVKKEQGGSARDKEGEKNNEQAELVDVSSQDERSIQNYFKREKDQVSEKGGKLIDLNKEILSGIVKLCRHQKLIPEELTHCFFTNFTTRLQKQYIEYYRANVLHRYDFGKAKINIVDHRRLTEMLISHNSDAYLPIKQGGAFDYLKEGKEFLDEIYAMSEEAYKALLDEQVNKYYQTWWGGPENLNPVPPDTFSQLADGDENKILEERERALKIQRLQEENEKNQGQQKGSRNQLAEIAKLISAKLYGKREQPQPKDVVKMQQPSIGNNSDDEGRHKKQKKEKREGEKQRKKSKKKKRRLQQVKREQMQLKQQQRQLQQSTGSKKVKS